MGKSERKIAELIDKPMVAYGIKKVHLVLELAKFLLFLTGLSVVKIM